MNPCTHQSSHGHGYNAKRQEPLYESIVLFRTWIGPVAGADSKTSVYYYMSTEEGDVFVLPGQSLSVHLHTSLNSNKSPKRSPFAIDPEDLRDVMCLLVDTSPVDLD